MTRPVEMGLAVVALVLTAALAAGVSGLGPATFRGSVSPSGADRYYHAGKTANERSRSDGCRGPGCHPGVPHTKVRAQAAFRNMHLPFVDCLACHGKDARRAWVAEPPAARTAAGGGHVGTQWRIAAPVRGAVARDKMHDLIGPALSCRACHSEEGLREITAAGIKDLRSGFANPVPLRMIEEGAKQWIPDTMR